MRQVTNKQIKVCLVGHGMRQYELAQRLGMSEGWLCQCLRKELPEDIQVQICRVIEGDAEAILPVRVFFRHKKDRDKTKDQRDQRIDRLYDEIRWRELEADILKEKEREEWLYEEKERKK